MIKKGDSKISFLMEICHLFGFALSVFVFLILIYIHICECKDWIEYWMKIYFSNISAFHMASNNTYWYCSSLFCSVLFFFFYLFFSVFFPSQLSQVVWTSEMHQFRRGRVTLTIVWSINNILKIKYDFESVRNQSFKQNDNRDFFQSNIAGIKYQVGRTTQVCDYL